MNYDSHVKAYNRNKFMTGLKNMDFFGVGTFLSGLADTIGKGIVDKRNFEEMKRQYEENKKFQREQFDYTKEQNDKNFKYQEWLNNKTMEREDNAVQRRMADLAKSGINPLMADGQSASSSGMSTAGSNTSSYHLGPAAQQNYSMDAGTIISAMLDMKRIKNEKAMTDIERERLSSQLLNDHENRLYTIAKRITEAKEPAVRDALISQYNANVKVLNAQARKLGLEADYLDWDMSIDKNRGTKSSENTSSKYNDAKDFLAGKGKNGEGNNPIVETVNKTGNVVSPVKQGTIEKMQEQNEKKYTRLKKTRRKRKWFSSAE